MQIPLSPPSHSNVEHSQMQLEQKWLTSIQLTAQLPREKPNTKHFAIFPGIFVVLAFCEKGKDAIYEIEFNAKPGADWNVVKCPESITNSIGAHLCSKTEANLMSGPICDIDLLAIQRKSRYGQSKEVLNVPHSFKLLSHQLPFGYLMYRKIKGRIEQTFKAVLTQKYLSAKASRINLSQLPLFCFPEGIKIVREIRGFLTFNFVFTLQTAERIYVTCLVFKQQLSEAKKEKLQVISNDQLFYEKALCIVSNQPYTDQFGECLQHLYRLSMSKSDVPFWRVTQTLINEMKMPLPSEIGEVGLAYSYGGMKINFPTNNRYPFVSQRALYSIFKFMCIENIISVFQSLLLERKVIFVSQSKTILGYATEAFLGLLYPFRWEQVLIPILPENLKQYLTAPVPLVAGISPALVDSSIETDSVIVYLDKNQILNDEDNPPLPQKLFKQLTKRLQKLQIYDPAEVTQFLQNPESTYLFKMQEVQDPQFHGHLVRDIFFQFLLTLMKNYKKFMTKPKNTKDHEESLVHFDGSALMNNIFKVQEFLSDLGMTKIGSFGYKFTESSIFTSFIEKKYQSPNHPEAIFFDDCIERKKSKKETSFIVPIQNKTFKQIKNPQSLPQDDGPFFYQQFPSLLKESVIQEQEIQLNIPDEREQQNKMIAIVQEEYHLNYDFFQPVECEDNLEKKMLSLLLNKNKPKYQSQNSQSKPYILSWFLGFYQKQAAEIQSILNEWPGVVCEEEFITLRKYEYFKNQNKLASEAIVGVIQGDDYQTLVKNQTKILFVGVGHGASFAHKSSAIVIEIYSHRIKSFINKLIPKQSGLLIEFCEKQAAKDLRASTLKKASEQTWNIETLLAFKSWLHYEKEFGTAVTHD